MIGPPALKLRMKKLLLGGGATGPAGLASAATVAETVGEVASAGAVPETGGTPGAVVDSGAAATEAPGAALSAGAAAAGDVASAGESVGSAGVVAGAAGLCAKPVSAMVIKQRLTISVFFHIDWWMFERFRR